MKFIKTKQGMKIVLISASSRNDGETESRFKKYTKRSPHLLNMIPQKDIASYLRIDPTNFSKLINTIKL